MHADTFAPGARVLIRDEEWMIRRVQHARAGSALHVVGLSELVRNQEALFLTELDDVEVLRAEDTTLVRDDSAGHRQARLYLEALLRRSPPTDHRLVIGHQGAIRHTPYQWDPAAQALKQMRPRILMADGSYLGPAFPISTAPGQQFRSGAVWTGTEFLAAWEDQRSAVSHFDWRTDIYGARITPTGTVLDPAGAPLATTPKTELFPDFLTTGTDLFLSLSTLRSDTTLGSFRIELRPLTDTCQPDLGFGGPGSATLTVCGEPLGTGQSATLTVVGVQPHAPVFLGFGTVHNPTPVFGGLIVPVPLAGTLALVSDAVGVATLQVPGGGGPLTVYAQVAFGDLSLPGLIGLTNAVGIELLP